MFVGAVYEPLEWMLNDHREVLLRIWLKSRRFQNVNNQNIELLGR